MQTNMQKGNELENAVRAIESAILREAPGYSEDAIRIHGKKIVQSDGVKHEIDVFVTVKHAPGYDSVFIFECKNWSSKVGKNELIIFSEKIKVSGAQKGFFIAKSFTRDAKAQAKKDSRISLLTAYNFSPLTRMRFPQFQLVNIISCEINAEIIPFRSDGVRQTIDLDGRSIVMNGKTYDAKEFIEELANKSRDQQINRSGVNDFPEGTYQIEIEETYKYTEDELMIDKLPIEGIKIKGMANVEKLVSSVVSIYEVESRGRLIKIGIESNGLLIEGQFVELPVN